MILVDIVALICAFIHIVAMLARCWTHNVMILLCASSIVVCA